MKKKIIKDWKGYQKLTEDESLNQDDIPFRLYGQGATPQSELISLLKSMIAGIKKADPSDQESWDKIKEDIKSKKEEIVSHPNFDEFKKKGFKWQDETIRLSDWQSELREAVSLLGTKAEKRGITI